MLRTDIIKIPQQRLDGIGYIFSVFHRKLKNVSFPPSFVCLRDGGVSSCLSDQAGTPLLLGLGIPAENRKHLDPPWEVGWWGVGLEGQLVALLSRLLVAPMPTAFAGSLPTMAGPQLGGGRAKQGMSPGRFAGGSPK